MKKTVHCLLIFLSFCFAETLRANLVSANPGDYTNYLGSLGPGDTLLLESGLYTNNLTINNISGTATQPIVIMGSGAIFLANACCNTVSITKCAYVVIKNLFLDGQNQDVDAVKAEGTAGNWAHHITLEYLHINNYDNDQQDVGISTKCPAWNWVIRKNTIDGAGTGMYLGNSSGDKPFVNGIIEYNYIGNTVGYNIEIKHQLNTVRDEFPGTQVNGKTIIRHNVFTKGNSSSTDADARPNLLVGGFPTSGWGSMDYYEIYGNFFYNNPVELFQGTGNIMLYENIFVNIYDPAGFRAVYLTPQNGVSPQDIKVFHNTVWTANSSGGIRLLNPNTAYNQYCYANAVFGPSPISNFTNDVDNVTDVYTDAGVYTLFPSFLVSNLDLYPKSGQLTGGLTPSALFQNDTDWDKDFNGDLYDWTYRGAYSGCCANNGWKLQLDTMPEFTATSNVFALSPEPNIEIYPNPVFKLLNIDIKDFTCAEVAIYNVMGERIYEAKPNSTHIAVDLQGRPAGIYFILIKNKQSIISRKVIKV